MLASSKRRASLYTLPLVVMIGFLSVAGLAAWQRSDVIADLADRVARGEKTEATAAVRQLAAIPKPPLAILVEAAASDERATAEAAQVAINRMLGKWQKQVDKKQRVSSVAAQVTELAAALAAQREAFPPADYLWLAGASRKIVRIANQCPAKKTTLVALHCDEIFSVVERSATAATVAGGAEDADVARKKAAATPAAEVVLPESQQALLEREFLLFPTPPVTNGWDSGVETAPNDSVQFQVPGTSDHESPLKGFNPLDQGQPHRPSPIEPIPLGQQWSPADGAARPDWSLPIFRILPAIPADINVDGDWGLGTIEIEPPAEISDSERAARETRALLEQWHDGSEYQRPALDEKLAERGFRRLSTRIVQQYLSDDLAERTRVVDSVLTEPGVDARPWLLLLAEDEDADVRLMAVSVMATSNDKTLIEAAWQAAISDHDPRIADLAERLRARRR